MSWLFSSIFASSCSAGENFIMPKINDLEKPKKPEEEPDREPNKNDNP